MPTPGLCRGWEKVAEHWVRAQLVKTTKFRISATPRATPQRIMTQIVTHRYLPTCNASDRYTSSPFVRVSCASALRSHYRDENESSEVQSPEGTHFASQQRDGPRWWRTRGKAARRVAERSRACTRKKCTRNRGNLLHGLQLAPLLAPWATC